jgi:ParB family chromosome partitioning protein
VSARAAERIAGLKKPDMATEAALLLDGRGWLPAVLRRAGEVAEPVEAEDAESAGRVEAAA